MKPWFDTWWRERLVGMFHFGKLKFLITIFHCSRHGLFWEVAIKCRMDVSYA